MRFFMIFILALAFFGCNNTSDKQEKAPLSPNTVDKSKKPPSVPRI